MLGENSNLKPDGESCSIKASVLGFLRSGKILVFLPDIFSASLTSARTEVHVVSGVHGFIVIRSSGALSQISFVICGGTL